MYTSSKILCVRCGGIVDVGEACSGCGRFGKRRRIFNDWRDVFAFALGMLGGFAFLYLALTTSKDGVMPFTPRLIVSLVFSPVPGIPLGLLCIYARMHLDDEPFDD